MPSVAQKLLDKLQHVHPIFSVNTDRRKKEKSHMREHVLAQVYNTGISVKQPQSGDIFENRSRGSHDLTIFDADGKMLAQQIDILF